MLWIKRAAWWPHHQPTPRRSDRELVAGICRSDSASLGALYDRYTRLVCTLACHTQPDSVEATLEEVFAQLWLLGRNQSMSEPILPLLIALATCPTVPVLFSPLYRTALPHVPLLEAFEHFEPFVRSVLILVRLGGLTVAEVAVALEVEPATVRAAIGAGLRQLQQGDDAPI